MEQINIGIVEDEAIIADHLQAVLEELNYGVPDPASTYEEGVALLETAEPDLMLLDIRLAGDADGIELARYIRQHYSLPLIFLTANSDAATVERAKSVRPDAFLVKPFQKADLFAAIEIALSNYHRTPEEKDPGHAGQKPFVFIKDDQCFHKLFIDEILYLSSEHVYVTVHTAQRKFLVRSGLQQYLEQLGSGRFFRVHRSHAVNLDHIERLHPSYVVIGGTQIPVSRLYKDKLMEALQIK